MKKFCKKNKKSKKNRDIREEEKRDLMMTEVEDGWVDISDALLYESQRPTFNYCINSSFAQKEEPESMNKSWILFTKFGILCTLLPYIGHRGKCMNLMTRLSKRSSWVWLDHERAFAEMFRRTKWTHGLEELEQLMTYYGLKTDWKLKGEQVLHVEFSHIKNQLEFLSKITSYSFEGDNCAYSYISFDCPKLNCNKIYTSAEPYEEYKIDEEDSLVMAKFNNFITCTLPFYIKVLKIDGGLDKPFSIYKHMLAPLLNRTEQKIIIAFFKLTQDDLKFIIENTTQICNLTLYKCTVSNVRHSFSLNPSLTYAMETFDLFGTIRDEDSSYLDPAKFWLVAEAMSKTNLVDTLKVAHVDRTFNPGDVLRSIRRVNTEYYNKPEWVEECFENYGFNVMLLRDCFMPTLTTP